MTETTDATAIFAPIWRRKWLILAVGVVVALGSYLYYKHERPTFSSSATVYVGASSEESSPGESGRKSSSVNVADQTTIIKSIVVEEVRRSLRRRHKGRLTHGTSVKAKAPEKSDFITISAEAHSVKDAELLANEVARAYITRRNTQRERSIQRTIALTRRQLRRLEAADAPLLPSSTSASGGKGVAVKAPSTGSILQQANLTSKIDQLEASLAISGAQQVKAAHSAELLSPEPKKDAVFGFVIGLVLASIAAYVLSRFDRRLRTLEGIESIFRVPVLTALPKVSRPLVAVNGTPAPSRQLVEPLRRLHTTLRLGSAGGGIDGEGKRVILFVSADPGDGRSTLIADLALVQRDGGERVAVVEANFRRPILSRMLRLGAAPSLAEVLAGTLTIEEAQRVSAASALPELEPQELATGAATTALATRGIGSLFVLAGSQAVPNPPALMADEAMAELLRTLAEDFDHVLLDAPSPLEFSDVMPLLRLVDGIVLVTRAGHTREASAQRLVQLLAQSSAAPILGVVANCVPQADIARHGLSAPLQRGWLSRLLGS